LFSSVIVGFKVAGELKDVELCGIAVSEASADGRLSTGWRVGMLLMNGMRRWCFLTMLVISVPLLVVFKGGGALMVCFNTVAIVFMCDTDDVCYATGMNEKVRARMEQAGRVTITEAHAVALFRTKIVHIGLVVVFCLWRVHLAGGAWQTVKQDLGPDDQKFGGKGSMQFAARVGLLPGLSFWLGGTCEAFF
jgi:hypothetical protein